jgi:hypothetical protein
VAPGAGCNSRTHTYTCIVTVASTWSLRLWVNDGTHDDDSGSLRVSVRRVHDPAPL